LFSHYFQEELSSLRELARDFSALHPALAPYLDGPSSDPDVERLLEGVAFLTGLMREKLDDEFPEIVHELMKLIWPHYLRPIPSTTIVAFKAKPGLKQPLTIPQNTSIASIPIEGTSCIFRTCEELEVHPCQVLEAGYRERAGKPLEIRILIELEGLKLADWSLKRLKFYLGGEYSSACDLYRLLGEKVLRIDLLPTDGGNPFSLPPSALEPGGFSRDEAMLPYPANAFTGYRVIQEFFINPRKFLFISINGLEQWTTRGDGSRFEVVFQLKKGSDNLPAIKPDSFILSAVPAINIFSHQADPVRLDHRKPKYPVRVSGSNPAHYQIYSVEKVTGLIQGSARERNYIPFELFGSEPSRGPFYNVLKQPGISGAGMDIFLSVAYPDESLLAPAETLSIDLLCTNGFLPEQLQAGDLCRPTSNTPELVEFKNISPASPGSLPALGRDLLWRLVSHLNLNYVSIASADNLKALLKLYVFTETRNKKQSIVNLRRIEGIDKINCATSDRLISGLVCRGQDILLQLRQDHFASPGDMYLFGAVLERFLGSYAALNSFTQVTLQESFTGEQFKWPPRIGDRFLL